MRDYVLELSMNANVQQSLATDELASIFREVDGVRDAVTRGGRGPTDELFRIVQAAVAQIDP